MVKLNSIQRAVLSSSIVAASLSLFAGAQEANAIKVQHGTALQDESYIQYSDTQKHLGTPNKLAGVKGPINMQKDTSKIFPKSKDYYLRNLPYQLKDTGGNIYRGFCADPGATMATAPTGMTSQGIMSDPKYYSLFAAAIPGGDLSKATDHQMAAIQMVMWAGNDASWDKGLFSEGVIDVNAATMSDPKVGETLKDIMAAWDDITTPKENMVPLKFGTAGEGVCGIPETPSAGKVLFEIPVNGIDGSTPSSLTDKIDVASSVGKAYVGETAPTADFGVAANPSSVYIVLNVGGTPSGSKQAKLHITYKGPYQDMSGFQLTVYKGGPNNQPFVMPVVTPPSDTVSLSWNCPPTPPCVDCDREVVPPKSEESETQLIWYNIPMAFGEFKVGDPGYGVEQTREQVTTKGAFADSRAQEPYEAMLGVPTTERFYANFGGTKAFLYFDVTYHKKEIKYNLTVKQPIEYYRESCDRDGSNCHWVTDSARGRAQYAIELFSSFKELRSMTVNNASYRLPSGGELNNSELKAKGKLKADDELSAEYTYLPNADGLITNAPGNNGSLNHMLRAEKTYMDSYTYTHSEPIKVYGISASPPATPEAGAISAAKAEANEKTGKGILQSESLKVTLDGLDLEVMSESEPIEYELFDTVTNEEPILVDTTGGLEQKFFKPLADSWSPFAKIPVKGYTGNPKDDSSRNKDGKWFYAEDIQIDEKLVNGIYDFEGDLQSNYLTYDKSTVIKGGDQTMKPTTDDLIYYQTPYKDQEKSMTIPGENLAGDKVFVHYTNWQSPVGSDDHGTTFKFFGEGNLPDGEASSDIDDKPRYKSINPVLLHNPVGAIAGWIHDVDDISDQRIRADKEHIIVHPSVISGRTRTFIDYAVTVSMPSRAAYETYPGQESKTSKEEGIVDTAYSNNPGILGKGYDQSFSYNTQRGTSNPYGGIGMNAAKWIDKKYVKFPYDVLQGGTTYKAGTWIKIQDQGGAVSFSDDAAGTFHVASDQLDKEGVQVEFYATALNDPSGAPGGDAEYLVNGLRGFGSKDQGAMHAANKGMKVDLIGRIGNFIISDATDPRFQEKFWDVDENGEAITSKPVQKEYGPLTNRYDLAVGSGTSISPYDRHGVMTPGGKNVKEGDEVWRKNGAPLNHLPLDKNTGKKGYEDQAMKTGYSVGGSIQTIGDYDYEMWIYPQHMLRGYMSAVPAKDGQPQLLTEINGTNDQEPFSLVTVDPNDNRIKEYYRNDVNVNPYDETEQTLLGTQYDPAYLHTISETLANPRTKISTYEKQTVAYQHAVKLGMATKETIGTPSMMIISKKLRTRIGSDYTSGPTGTGLAKDMISSDDCNCSFYNSQKWNFNFSLPDHTKIWFYGKTKEGTPIFETPSKDKEILTKFHSRTKVQRPGMGSSTSGSGSEGGGDSSSKVPTWDLSISETTTSTDENGDTPTPGGGGGGDDDTPTPGNPSYTKWNPTPYDITFQTPTKSTDSDTVGTH